MYEYTCILQTDLILLTEEFLLSRLLVFRRVHRYCSQLLHMSPALSTNPRQFTCRIQDPSSREISFPFWSLKTAKISFPLFASSMSSNPSLPLHTAWVSKRSNIFTIGCSHWRCCFVTFLHPTMSSQDKFLWTAPKHCTCLQSGLSLVSATKSGLTVAKYPACFPRLATVLKSVRSAQIAHLELWGSNPKGTISGQFLLCENLFFNLLDLVLHLKKKRKQNIQQNNEKYIYKLFWGSLSL